MWEWYTAVLMWKSQSPWPALRGSLYDYYLEQSGGYWGVRHALSTNVDQSGAQHGLHVQLDLSTLRPTVVNKGAAVRSTIDGETAQLSVTVTAYDLASAAQVAPPFVWSLGDSVTASSVTMSDEPFPWPALDDAGRTLYLELELAAVGNDSVDVLGRNHYWLNRGTAAAQDYSDLGTIVNTTPPVKLALTAVVSRYGSSGPDGAVELELEVGVNYRGSTGVDPVAIWCVLSLEAPLKGGSEPVYERLLPTRWTDNAVALMPGASTLVRATTRLPNENGHVRVRVAGWHVEPAFVDVEVGN